MTHYDSLILNLRIFSFLLFSELFRTFKLRSSNLLSSQNLLHNIVGKSNVDCPYGLSL